MMKYIDNDNKIDIDNNEEIKILSIEGIIGNGSYGKVYRVLLNNNIIAVVKHIEYSKTNGIICLLEPYIMKYIRNDHLLDSFHTNIDEDNNLSIIQPIALGNASDLIRKQEKSLSLINLKQICWQLVVAVAELHSKGIAHGDIKAANVLLFDKMYVKLGDYGLSTLIMNPDIGTCDKNGHISYTPTHRPPEIWHGNNWSYPADIWALGCTFYELCYRNLLFPVQKISNKSNNLRSAYINCIESWEYKNPKYDTYNKLSIPNNIPENILPLVEPIVFSKTNFPTILTNQKIKLTPIKPINIGNSKNTNSLFNRNNKIPGIDFKECNINSEWENSNNYLFNEVLLSMLQLDQHKRSTIWQLINHRFFDEVRCNINIDKFFPTINYFYNDLPLIIINEAKELSSDKQVVEIALMLYNRSRNNSLGSPLLETCITMAHKMLYNILPLDTNNKITFKHIQDEKLLLKILDYQLLP